MEGGQTIRSEFKTKDEATEYVWKMMLDGFAVSASHLGSAGDDVWVIWATYR